MVASRERDKDITSPLFNMQQRVTWAYLVKRIHAIRNNQIKNKRSNTIQSRWGRLKTNRIAN